jgi:hypothetical protein
MLPSAVKYSSLRQSSLLGGAMRCMGQRLDGYPRQHGRYNTVSIRGSVDEWKSEEWE